MENEYPKSTISTKSNTIARLAPMEIRTIEGPLYTISKKLVVPELVLKVEGFYRIPQIHANGATVLSV